jgi:hypothetical protein
MVEWGVSTAYMKGAHSMEVAREGAHRLLERFDLDSIRLQTNPVWLAIHDVAFSVFGPLATFAFGQVTGEFLDRNYIQHFRGHIAPDAVREFVQEQHAAADLNFIQLYSGTPEAKANYILQYNDFRLDALLEDGKKKMIALLGNVGAGKTSLIAYSTQHLPKNICLLTDNLAYCETEEHVVTDIYTSIPEQLGRLVLEVGKEQGLSLREIQTDLHREALEQADAVVTGDEDAVEAELKEQRRSHMILKVMDAKMSRSRDAQLYMIPAVAFLKRHEKKVCIVLDDIDRVEDDNVAKLARTEALFLSDILDIPVVIAARESTVRKGLDVYGFEHVLHLCPPRYSDVLDVRLKTFCEEIEKRDIPSQLIDGTKLNKEEYCSIVQNVIRAIREEKRNLYLFSMLSNGSIALMLDYLRTVLASPHLTARDLIQIASGQKIGEHKVLESLMLYVYAKINPWNTYLLNIYNADHPDTGLAFNALFRLRVLQCIRAVGKVKSGLRTLDFASLRSALLSLGWEDEQEAVLEEELQLLEDYGLVEIMQFNHEIEKHNASVMLRDAGYLYVTHLFSRYRYLETVIPDCWLDYEASDFNLSSGLQNVDKEVEKFIGFISRCEEEERSRMRDEGREILEQGQGEIPLSTQLKRQFEYERDRQMRSGRER